MRPPIRCAKGIHLPAAAIDVQEITVVACSGEPVRSRKIAVPGLQMKAVRKVSIRD